MFMAQRLQKNALSALVCYGMLLYKFWLCLNAQQALGIVTPAEACHKRDESTFVSNRLLVSGLVLLVRLAVCHNRKCR